MITQVYRNLHRKCYSLRDKRTRLVNGHEVALLMLNVRFIVSEKGRQRVLAEKRKNVHAFVEGTVVLTATEAGTIGTFVDALVAEGVMTKVAYNPYKGPHFVRCDTGEAITEAIAAYLTPKGCFVHVGE